MAKKQKFLVEGVVYEAPVKSGETLLDVAIRAKLPLLHSCGGMGTCGTCRVLVCEGLENLPAPDDVENDIIKDRGFDPHERLGCQIYPSEGLLVEIPKGPRLD